MRKLSHICGVVLQFGDEVAEPMMPLQNVRVTVPVKVGVAEK